MSSSLSRNSSRVSYKSATACRSWILPVGVVPRRVVGGVRGAGCDEGVLVAAGVERELRYMVVVAASTGMHVIDSTMLSVGAMRELNGNF